MRNLIAAIILFAVWQMTGQVVAQIADLDREVKIQADDELKEVVLEKKKIDDKLAALEKAVQDVRKDLETYSKSLYVLKQKEIMVRKLAEAVPSLPKDLDNLEAARERTVQSGGVVKITKGELTKASNGLKEEDVATITSMIRALLKEESGESAAAARAVEPPSDVQRGASQALVPRMPVEDTFWFAPRVQRITESQDLDQLLRSECDYNNANGEFLAPVGLEATECPARRTRFDAPAHFPMPRFGQSGQLFKEEGAMIYEGMQFVSYDTGRYRIRFVVGTPGMAVALRLRLVLYDANKGREVTLTLPMISLVAQDTIKETDKGRPREILYLVQANGYLPALKHNLHCYSLVRREGTARFGFGLSELP